MQFQRELPWTVLCKTEWESPQFYALNKYSDTFYVFLTRNANILKIENLFLAEEPFSAVAAGWFDRRRGKPVHGWEQVEPAHGAIYRRSIYTFHCRKHTRG